MDASRPERDPLASPFQREERSSPAAAPVPSPERGGLRGRSPNSARRVETGTNGRAVARRADSAPKLLSIVVPAFDEEAAILEFHRALRREMRALGQRFETVFVNDGSRDKTLLLMKELRARHRNTTIVDLSRNFGKEIAVTAGLDHARGDAVVVMDADLQHPPEIIGALIEGWREGYDVVNAQRIDRRGESFLRRATAQAFYRLMNSGRAPLPENVGDFRLLSRKAVDAVVRLREHHRFMKGVFAWIGFSSKTVPYEARPRVAGRTKFDYWRLWNFSIEGLTSHTLAPLKVSSYLGLAVALFSFASGVFYIGKTILFGDPVPGFPTVVTTMLFLGGVQLIVLGVMGEYLGRVFNETKLRPLYFANEVMRAEAGDADACDPGEACERRIA
jgi:glycosyltransferase involved in cell wall biosynthesis